MRCSEGRESRINLELDPEAVALCLGDGERTHRDVDIERAVGGLTYAAEELLNRAGAGTPVIIYCVGIVTLFSEANETISTERRTVSGV